MDTTIYRGCVPALMTPCLEDRTPDYEALVDKAQRLMAAGMSGVVYCGSMGDWPLLTDEQRQQGVAKLVEAGVPVIVGTGAQSPAIAVAHASHAQAVGAQGLMVIPRVLSRGISVAAQRAHFDAILSAAPDLPSVIYNSPYYGYETRADLFFELRQRHANLVGFKEFGGRDSLSYAAEHITSQSDDLLLLAGVDTQVYHGIVRCGASGAITGIGNCLPEAVLRMVELCHRAAKGDETARAFAAQLEESLAVLSSFDEGPDLVLYYKHLLVCLGDTAFERQINPTDALTDSQRRYCEAELTRFQTWWDSWPGKAD